MWLNVDKLRPGGSWTSITGNVARNFFCKRWTSNGHHWTWLHSHLTLWFGSASHGFWLQNRYNAVQWLLHRKSSLPVNYLPASVHFLVPICQLSEEARGPNRDLNMLHGSSDPLYREFEDGRKMWGKFFLKTQKLYWKTRHCERQQDQ